MVDWNRVKKDPIDDELDFVEVPNQERRGPLIGDMDNALKEQRDDSYHHDDKSVGHMSASSGCSRKNYLNYIFKGDEELENIPPSPESLFTFKHGDVVHEMIQDMYLKKFGTNHVTVEESIEKEIGDGYKIYGHADLVFRGLDHYPDPFVVDIKTKGSFTFYNRGLSGYELTVPKKSNIMQLNGYLHAIGAEYGALLYVNKSDGERHEYWFARRDDLWEEAKENIKTVLEHVQDGEPAPKDADSYLCDDKYCKYYREGLCSGVDNDKPLSKEFIEDERLIPENEYK